MYVQNDSNEEYVILEFNVHQKSSFSLTRLVILNLDLKLGDTDNSYISISSKAKHSFYDSI